MSTDRIPKKAGFINVKTMPRGPGGNPLCRQCNEETPGPRRTFCSKECVHAWKLTTDRGYQAVHVRKRDSGVCALCARNTYEEQRAVQSMAGRFPLPASSPRFEPCTGDDRDSQFPAIVEAARALGLIGKKAKPKTRWNLNLHRQPWEMDHTKPVVEGGGGCGLENLRTLCIPCHRAQTADLARRRAKERRAANAVKKASKNSS